APGGATRRRERKAPATMRMARSIAMRPARGDHSWHLPRMSSWVPGTKNDTPECRPRCQAPRTTPPGLAPADAGDQRAEALVRGLLQERVAAGLEQHAGIGPGPLQQLPIARQPGVPEVAAAALQLAEQVAFAAHVEVDLGQVEAARVLRERLQA